MGLDFHMPPRYIFYIDALVTGIGSLSAARLANSGLVPYIAFANAGIAQLVERNLAKVDVAGSNPVSRSALRGRGWSVIAPSVSVNTLPL